MAIHTKTSYGAGINIAGCRFAVISAVGRHHFDDGEGKTGGLHIVYLRDPSVVSLLTPRAKGRNIPGLDIRRDDIACRRLSGHFPDPFQGAYPVHVPAAPKQVR